MKKKNRGFTVLELLVVIAIIGILSAIVLTSVTNSRDKAKDSAILSNMRTIMTQAEVWFATKDTYFTTKHYVSNSSYSCNNVYAYGSTLFGDENIKQAIIAIDSANGSYNIDCRVRELADGSSTYVVATKNTKGNNICVDKNNIINTGTAADNLTIVYCNY